MANRNDSLPEWVESKLFENVLREIIDDFSKVLEFKAFPALAPGENYATVMIKIEAKVLLENGSTVRKSLMLKVPHNSELYRKEMTKWDMFATEAGMYQEIVPDFENLYNKIGVEVHFGARSYKLPVEKEYILLENLMERGFRNSPRQDCLDMEHCKSVMKKLAQWHAASAVRTEQKGPYHYNYAKGMFIKDGKEILMSMLEGSLKHLLKVVPKLSNHQEYLPQLENLTHKLFDLLCTQPTEEQNEFQVLNHGDCWSNNIMFQYDKSGKLLETYFVDLQVPRFGSPAQDLLYFIFSSAQLDIKINKFDYMIKYYHENLIEHLKLLKYEKPLPTLMELHATLLRQGQWGFFAALVTLAAVLCDPTDEASVDNLISGGEEADKFKELMYTNERYLKHMEVILPWLFYRGALQLSA